MPNVNGIPSHKKWTQWRDESGGKSNMCGKVNIGKLLDAVDKAGGSPKKRREALEKVSKGLLTYRADKAVKAIPELFKTAGLVRDHVEKEIVAIRKNSDIGLEIGVVVVDGLKRCQKLMAKPNPQLYGKMWDGIGRGLGKSLMGHALRDGWMSVHTKVPTREAVEGEKDEEKQLSLIVEGVTAYEVGLKQLVEDAKALNIVVKLH